MTCSHRRLLPPSAAVSTGADLSAHHLPGARLDPQAEQLENKKMLQNVHQVAKDPESSWHFLCFVVCLFLF